MATEGSHDSRQVFPTFISQSPHVFIRIYLEDKSSFLQDCEDDGETAAGGRLLHLLQVNVCLRQVTDWLVDVNQDIMSSIGFSFFSSLII